MGGHVPQLIDDFVQSLGRKLLKTNWADPAASSRERVQSLGQQLASQRDPLPTGCLRRC